MTRKQIYALRRRLQKLGFTQVTVHRAKHATNGYYVGGYWHGIWCSALGYNTVGEAESSMRNSRRRTAAFHNLSIRTGQRLSGRPIRR